MDVSADGGKFWHTATLNKVPQKQGEWGVGWGGVGRAATRRTATATLSSLALQQQQGQECGVGSQVQKQGG